MLEVADRSAAPAVDRLGGVADRGDREAAAVLGVGTGEERLQQVALRHRRVLVLVEQDDAEPLAQHRTHLGQEGELGAPRHLVGEVHHPVVGLAGAVAVDEMAQLDALVRRGRGVAQHGLRLGRGEELADHLVVVGPHDLRLHQVLGQLGVEVHGLRDQARHVRGDVAQLAGIGLDRAGHALEAGRIGDEPQVRLDAQPQPVLGDEGAGERVVRGRGGLARRRRRRAAAGSPGCAARARPPPCW